MCVLGTTFALLGLHNEASRSNILGTGGHPLDDFHDLAVARSQSDWLRLEALRRLDKHHRLAFDCLHAIGLHCDGGLLLATYH